MSIFSVTYSISLTYLLSIPLLYFCFYTLHISYSFYNLLLFISYHYFSDYVNFYHTFHISLRSVELILYYHIIYCHRFSYILSWLYTIPFVIFYFHVLLSCIVFIYCFSVILFILLSLLCTVLVHILFVYYHILSYMIFIHCAFYILYFHILYLSYTFRVIDTLLLVLVYLSSHSNAMLLISCHVLLSFSNHVHISVISFMFHVCINFRSGYGK